MTIGHRLSTATFDTLAWTAVLLLATQALVDRRPRLWMVAGRRRGGRAQQQARGRVPPARDPGGARPGPRGPARAGHPLALDRRLCAALLWLPNLVWQWRHDWPAVDLSADIADEYGGVAGRLGMVGEAFAMFSPLLGVLWVIGTVQLLRRPEWSAARLPALVLLVVTAVLLVTGGKGYYLAGAIVPSLAAGCTWLAMRWSGRRLVLAGAGLAVSAMVAWPALVPVLPAQTFADSFYTGLNDDQVETIGWPAYAAVVREVVAGQPERCRGLHRATTERPAPSSGTASEHRSSAATTASGTGALRRRRQSPSWWSATATRPSASSAASRSPRCPARWTSTTRSRVGRCGCAAGRSAAGSTPGTGSCTTPPERRPVDRLVSRPPGVRH